MSNFTAWLKLVHVLGAIVWVGGSVVTLAYGLEANRGSVAERRIFTENSILAGKIFNVAGIVVFIAGVWMVVRHPVYDFDQAWIIIGLGGIALGVMLGVAFYGPQARAVLAELDAGEAAGAGRGRRIARVAGAEIAVLTFVVWAMVFKPGL